MIISNGGMNRLAPTRDISLRYLFITFLIHYIAYLLHLLFFSTPLRIKLHHTNII